MVHKARGRDDVDLAHIHLRLGTQARHPAKVVAMAVAVHDGVQPAFAIRVAVFAVQRERRCRCVWRGQSIQRYQTRITLDEGDVGDVVTTHLEHARCHFKQAVNAVQPRLAPQAGVDRVSGLLVVQKTVTLQAPDWLAVRRLDLGIVNAANEPPVRISPVLPVFIRQAQGNQAVEVERGLVGAHGCLRFWF